MRFFEMRLRAVFVSSILMLTSGCEGLPAQDEPEGQLGDTFTSFEAWKASLPRDPYDGAYLVEGDIPVHDPAMLESFYARAAQPGALIVDVEDDADNRWNGAWPFNLTYCVSTSFGVNHDAVVAAIASAARDWERAAAVRFFYVSAHDGACTATNTSVAFNVRPVSDTTYNARAFFPSYAREEREVLINWAKATNDPPKTLTGILRHELGHALGFRHEHIRSGAEGCPTADDENDEDWRPLTPYDPASVMHYPPYSWPVCNGANWGDYVLTQMDKDGAASLYGPSLPDFDYDADFATDRMLWRPSNGMWSGVKSSGGTLSQQWGLSGDVPASGDYDGDGKSDYAVFRPSNGTWYVIDSSTGNSWSSAWGNSGDVPVPGDYDRDGKTDLAVWRPVNKTWYVINSSTWSSWSWVWGEVNDVPVPADYDRDGKTDMAVWRPSNGTWYVINSSTGAGWQQQWGLNGDYPVPGDYDRDGMADLAVWRPSNGTWYTIDSSTGWIWQSQWGLNGDYPVPGDYDRDGKTDLAVWRPSNGTWYTIRSSTWSSTQFQWGVSGDVPVNRRSTRVVAGN